MSSNDIAIRVDNLSKCYHIYEKPSDRLKQFVLPIIHRLLGITSKQYYKEFWALKDVSFEVKKGQTLGIIGRNGSGKSTLLQLICGTLNATSGNVNIGGRVAAILELGSGFNPEFTGRENVYLNATLLGLTQNEIDDRYTQILEFADIGDFIDQPVKTYSSGMLVRLAFAVIANVDADILVIDEALAVGDAIFNQKCMRFLRQFMTAGTVIFVSHDTGSVKGLCSQAIWLERGLVKQMGAPKVVSEKYLSSLYEGQQEINGLYDVKNPKEFSVSSEFKNQRMELINKSKLRNDLKVFKFNLNGPEFGKGGGIINNVYFLDEHYQPIDWVVGGELVRLRVCANILNFSNSPIIGFYVRDKLGQELFGDNTFLTYRNSSIKCPNGTSVYADFVFYMPILPVGDYSITVALAEGSQETHIQHHWIHEAIIFKSESSSVVTGLVGVPMMDIILIAESNKNGSR